MQLPQGSEEQRCFSCLKEMHARAGILERTFKERRVWQLHDMK
jgi:hypothetical protein